MLIPEILWAESEQGLGVLRTSIKVVKLIWKLCMIRGGSGLPDEKLPFRIASVFP